MYTATLMEMRHLIVVRLSGRFQDFLVGPLGRRRHHDFAEEVQHL
jgi:hypothetical protein